MFKTFLAFLAALGWHHWHIATFRPAYKHLPDTPAMLGGFIGYFIASAFLRVDVGFGEPYFRWERLLWLTGGGLLVVGLLLIVVYRRQYSRSFAACLLGSLTVVNVLAGVCRLTGFMPFAGDLFWLLLSIMLTGWNTALFAFQPDDVRQRGYHPAKAKSPT